MGCAPLPGSAAAPPAVLQQLSRSLPKSRPHAASQWVCEVTEPYDGMPAIRSDLVAPGSNSSRSSMGQVQGTMVLIRFFYLIVFIVLLHALPVGGAPWQAREAGEGGGDGYRAAWLDLGLEPLGHPADPLKVDSFPTSSPMPVLEPTSNLTAVPVGEGDAASQLGSRSEALGGGMGLPRPKDQAEGPKEPLETFEILGEILKALERRGHEMDQEATKPKVFPEQTSNSPPVRAEGTEAMPGARMLDAVSKRNSTVNNVQRPTSVYFVFSCPAEVRRRCMIGAAVFLVLLLLAIVSCCFFMQRQKKRKQFSATSGAGLAF